ncbi:GCN5 family acetyltransferase [Prauserella marina]|uniref:Ribosomal-protein-alanine N-acetyltransferase n=1 Tax=Prauserella marina TaxID=530584 RepID=A0A222VWL9_9PSEU|nr:GNAT family protein [Prauserella marina]ASR38111.1 GCN5 family acetyltransferase [Prauserella marina]PWV78731.1 ribosomal-protein-alanine N-acetyltransferase [Prauserella marina]SDC92381.1 ribosomal-protein-alanine N-acetyltransferase [Prauserella marina]
MASQVYGTPYGAEPRHPGWPARLGPLDVAAGTVMLRPIRLRDGGDWSRIRLRDHTYLERWEPTAAGPWSERNALWAWPSQWLSLRGLARRGQCLPFVITVDGAFAGQITIGNVIRASLRSAWVGYWVSSELAGGGVATAAVALLADHAFTSAGLHRLEATVRPENGASVRVLTKAGFRQEGLFLRYLDVAGDWRDHLSFAVTAEEIGEGFATRLVAGGLATRPAPR